MSPPQLTLSYLTLLTYFLVFSCSESCSSRLVLSSKDPIATYSMLKVMQEQNKNASQSKKKSTLVWKNCTSFSTCANSDVEHACNWGSNWCLNRNRRCRNELLIRLLLEFTQYIQYV